MRRAWWVAVLVAFVVLVAGASSTARHDDRPPGDEPTLHAYAERAQVDAAERRRAVVAERRDRRLAAVSVVLDRPAATFVATCHASWYGDAFAGRSTASGVPFDPAAMTAAHRTLPFGTRVEVRGPAGRATVVVNDRGPWVAGRCIDLSRAAFAAVAPLGSGTADVELHVLSGDA